LLFLTFFNKKKRLYFISFSPQYLCRSRPEVALNDDFTVFGRAADSAFGFQQFGKRLQIGFGSYKSFDKRYLLASAMSLIERNPQTLTGRRQSFLLSSLAGIVFLIGVGRINHSQSVAPIIMFHKILFFIPTASY